MKGILKILLRTIGASLIQQIIQVLFDVFEDKVKPKMKQDHREIVDAALPLLRAELNEETAKEIAKRI